MALELWNESSGSILMFDGAGDNPPTPTAFSESISILSGRAQRNDRQAIFGTTGKPKATISLGWTASLTKAQSDAINDWWKSGVGAGMGYNDLILHWVGIYSHHTTPTVRMFTPPDIQLVPYSTNRIVTFTLQEV